MWANLKIYSEPHWQPVERAQNRGDWEPVGGGTGRTDQSQCAGSLREEMRACATFSRSLKGRWLEFCNSKMLEKMAVVTGGSTKAKLVGNPLDGVTGRKT